LIYITENGNVAVEFNHEIFIYQSLNHWSKRENWYNVFFLLILIYVKETIYSLVYIGIDEFNDHTLSLEEALADTSRVDYFHDHLYYLQSAIE